MTCECITDISIYEIVSLILSVIAIIITIINLFISRRKKIKLDILGYTNFNLNNKDYLVVSLFIENKSSLPISISRFELIHDKNNINSLENKVLLYSTKTVQKINDKEEVKHQKEYCTVEYPIVLNSFDIYRGYIIFLTNIKFEDKINLTIFTSRGKIKKKIRHIEEKNLKELIIADIRKL